MHGKCWNGLFGDSDFYFTQLVIMDSEDVETFEVFDNLVLSSDGTDTDLLIENVTPLVAHWSPPGTSGMSFIMFNTPSSDESKAAFHRFASSSNTMKAKCNKSGRQRT
jgi:hypothetical protein